MMLIQNQKNRGMRLTQQLGFLLNIGSHQTLPRNIKIIPHVKKGEPYLRKKDQLLHQERKSIEDN
jgi:hypothetical protein